MIKDKSELYTLLNQLNQIMPSADYGFDFAYDGVKLTRANQSVSVSSGYMSKKQMIEWLRAFKSGYYACLQFGTKES